jgi:Opacity protein and related surface antigens
MKNTLIRCGLFALALTMGLSAASAPAQELNSFYVTPKILYSKQTGDMSNANWTQNGWSRGVLGGEEKDGGFGFGLAFGNDFSYSTAYPIRVEAEYIYHGEGQFGKGPSIVNALDNAGNYVASQKFKIKAHSLMVNGFYDINMDSAFTPYIGGGIGMAYLKSAYTSSFRVNGNEGHRVSTSSNDWSFAWNIGGGVSYALDNQMSLDFGYRYYDLGTAEPGSVNYANGTTGYRGSPEVDLTAHELSVGLRFSGF